MLLPPLCVLLSQEAQCKRTHVLPLSPQTQEDNRLAFSRSWTLPLAEVSLRSLLHVCREEGLKNCYIT